jgi:hypothetical protein
LVGGHGLGAGDAFRAYGVPPFLVVDALPPPPRAPPSRPAPQCRAGRSRDSIAVRAGADIYHPRNTHAQLEAEDDLRHFEIEEGDILARKQLFEVRAVLLPKTTTGELCQRSVGPPPRPTCPALPCLHGSVGCEGGGARFRWGRALTKRHANTHACVQAVKLDAADAAQFEAF